MISSIRLLTLSTLLLTALQDDTRTGLTVRGTVQNFAPVTDEVLRNPALSDWLMLRHDYSATSYSPLDQISAANVKTLKLAWMWPMREGGTIQPGPLVYRGTL